MKRKKKSTNCVLIHVADNNNACKITWMANIKFFIYNNFMLKKIKELLKL